MTRGGLVSHRRFSQERSCRDREIDSDSLSGTDSVNVERKKERSAGERGRGVLWGVEEKA